ncbi:MAG TPA: dihydropteroate synthase [Calditerricola sp.]
MMQQLRTLSSAVRRIEARGKTLVFGERTLVMGILNVTPDSFSDGGRYNRLDVAVRRAVEMVEEGADVIDIGGESTRPGAVPVSLEEELERVIPVVERVAREVDVPISVDTYKAEVARQALEAGAHLVNDVWGLKADPDMARVVAEYGAPVILMHNRRDPRYRDLVADLVADLRESIALARAAGIPDERIILDPGIGFAKTYEQNVELMRRLDAIVALGYPVLLGTSRKSLIGRTLDLPVNERLEGTIATAILGIVQGVDMVRVHDVKAHVRACRMADAIVRGRWA